MFLMYGEVLTQILIYYVMIFLSYMMVFETCLMTLITCVITIVTRMIIFSICMMTIYACTMTFETCKLFNATFHVSMTNGKKTFVIWILTIVTWLVCAVSSSYINFQLICMFKLQTQYIHQKELWIMKMSRYI